MALFKSTLHGELVEARDRLKLVLVEAGVLQRVERVVTSRCLPLRIAACRCLQAEAGVLQRFERAGWEATKRKPADIADQTAEAVEILEVLEKGKACKHRASASIDAYESALQVLY